MPGIFKKKDPVQDAKRREIVAAGTVVGVQAGAVFQKWLNAQEQKCLQDATQDSLKTGQKQTVQGDKGLVMTTESVGSDNRPRNVSVPVEKSVADAGVPPLDLIMQPYEVSVRKMEIRKAPDEKSDVVGELKKDAVVQVVGKVQDKPWMLVQQNGAATGYAEEKNLKVTDKPLPISTVQTADSVQAQVPANVTCRTVKQTVTKDGNTAEDEVTACQTADGWEIVEA